MIYMFDILNLFEKVLWYFWLKYGDAVKNNNFKKIERKCQSPAVNDDKNFGSPGEWSGNALLKRQSSYQHVWSVNTSSVVKYTCISIIEMCHPW